jgi:hypothetical protein
MLTAIDLPPLSAAMRMAYVKQGGRGSFDWPLADVAVLLDFALNENCRSARQRRSCRPRGRYAARQERLQGAVVRGPYQPRDPEGGRRRSRAERLVH